MYSYLICERGIRGGISIGIKRHAYSSSGNILLYLDANNLYSWVMSEPLPKGNFKFEDPNTDIMAIFGGARGRNIEYFFEVDLH